MGLAWRWPSGQSRSRTCSAPSARHWAWTRAARTPAMSAGPFRWSSTAQRCARSFEGTQRRRPMRRTALLAVALAALPVTAADVESRVLTHYLPQDFLETAVRTEGWTEVALKIPGGLRKGDVVRVWSGGLIDRGNGEKPGECVCGPAGVQTSKAPADAARLALAPRPQDAF